MPAVAGRRPGRDLAAVLTAVGMLVLPVSPPAAQLPSPEAAAQLPSPEAAAREPWEAGVEALLERRARAVREGDEEAFRHTMAGAPGAFIEGRLAWFRRLQDLPLGEYRLELEPDGFGDLSPALEDPPDAEEVRVVHAVERMGLAGYDEHPAVRSAYFTVVRSGERWSLVGDQDLAHLDLRSPRAPWDFGEVETIGGGGVLVLFHPGDRAAAARVHPMAVAALERLRDTWPYPWEDRAVVVLPGSAADLAAILQTTFDLGPFVAFLASSFDRADGWRYGGHRVYLQPETFFAASASFQADTLGHELVHQASRSVGSPFVPSWLDEAVAIHYGEANPRALGELRARVEAGRFRGRLPRRYQFVLGPREEIRFSYQSSASFASFLAEGWGAEAAAQLYRAIGERGPVAPGTGRYHLESAVREVFDRPFAALEREWAASLDPRLAA